MKVVLGLRRRISASGEAHSAVRRRLEVHPVEAGIVVRPALERTNRVDADPVQAVRARLVKGNHRRVDLHDVQQKVLVAHSGEPVLLFCRRESRHVVDALGFEPGDVLLHRGGQRCLCEERLPCFQGIAALAAAAPTRCAHHQPIGSERLLVEERGRV